MAPQVCYFLSMMRTPTCSTWWGRSVWHRREALPGPIGLGLWSARQGRARQEWLGPLSLWGAPALPTFLAHRNTWGQLLIDALSFKTALPVLGLEGGGTSWCFLAGAPFEFGAEGVFTG